jgi:hypothetical protein
MSEPVEKLKSETALVNLDGFDGYTDESEGDEQDQDQFTSRRVIQGERIDFTNEAVWVGANKQPLPSNLQLIVADVLRVVQKWGHDNMPAEEPIILAPNQKWPNIQAMNDACPKTEWRMRFGELVGPYQAQKIVYLWDPITMNKYTWPTSSNSGMACVSELAEKISMMRQFKKQKAIPVVKLSSRLWSRRYNKQGPNLVALQWIVKDESGALLPITEMPALASPKPTTTQEVLDQFAGVETVTPPSGKEATGDEIRF